LGLLEAKNAVERLGVAQTFPIAYKFSQRPDFRLEFENQCRILSQNGFKVGDPINELLDELRKLGSQALTQGEDELANEILQLVLSEKLRRQP